MENKYYKIEEILKEIDTPKYLDYINLNYKGINIKVYGVLHAITGGTNKEYLDFVNETIKNEESFKFCEKSMKVMYEGLDEEVEDWYQIKYKDAFLFSFKAFANPTYLYTLIKTTLREKINKKSIYNKTDIHIPTELSGDKRFHLLKPIDRRVFAGFPLPEQYFNLNIRRREGKEQKRINFADPDWYWLSYVEPYGNIPLRSIHMIEYVAQYCIKNNKKEASLFIGEIHNSDIEWFVHNKNNNTLPDNINKYAQQVEKEVENILNKTHSYKYSFYITSLFLGVFSVMLGYTFLTLMIINNFF